MNKYMKMLYAVTLVLPIVKNALTHLVSFVTDTFKDIRETWAEAMDE